MPSVKLRKRRTRQEVDLKRLTSFDMALKTEIYEEIRDSSYVFIREVVGHQSRTLRLMPLGAFQKMLAEYIYMIRTMSRFIIEVDCDITIYLEFVIQVQNKEFIFFKRNLCVLNQ